jgi:hypothetical protein
VSLLKKFNKSDWTAIIVFFVILQVISLWCIDVSISAMSVRNYGQEKNLDDMANLDLTNGFFQQNPIVAYHMSLFFLIISFFIIALISIHQINEK